MPPCLRADRSTATLRFARNKGGSRNRPLRSEGCGVVLRSPRDTEAAAADDGVGREVVALRATAVAGDVAPEPPRNKRYVPVAGPVGLVTLPDE